MPHPADKQQLRPHFRRRRRQALETGDTLEALQRHARERLPALVGPAQQLGLYWPIGAEPDLDPWAPGGLAEQLAACRSGRGLALPLTLAPQSEGSQGALVYRSWPRGAVLQPDACGIPAPLSPAVDPSAVAPSAVDRAAVDRADPAVDRGAPAGPIAAEGPPIGCHAPGALPPGDLALLLVPALALDAQGIRLGSGGGWYDRLRSDPHWRAVPALAVLPSVCRCEALPRDPWDVPFDGWLDEQGLGWFHPSGRAPQSEGPRASPMGA